MRAVDAMYPDAFVCEHDRPDRFVKFLRTEAWKPNPNGVIWMEYVKDPDEEHGYQQMARKAGKKRIVWVSSTDPERILFQGPVK